MPALKRAVRMASRDSFMGGDFINADLLRVNYTADYVATVAEKAGGNVVLELKAKGPEVAYDRIRLTLTDKAVAVSSEFYATSGKLLRAAEYSDAKPWGDGHMRPTRIKMLNQLVPARWSELETHEFKTN